MVYQIYPRSFADSNGDGIGDLPGVLEHLDHIRELGIEVIWLSPVYASPQVDNGYDVSDYQSIDPAFGTLADLDRLIEACLERGMRLIMDMVVNHTSKEHPWFIESRQSRDNAKADWYIWRDPRPGTVPGEPGSEPNNWGSTFSGSAWEWVPEREQFYLHVFAVEQPDLNWESPEVRAAVFAMMGLWLDRGIGGFRLDVINYLSKVSSLPDGVPDRFGYGDGAPFYSNGPRLREYLREMKERVFEGRPGSYLTVGEMPGVTPAVAREFTDSETAELSMVFQFDHVALDQGPDKWTPRGISVHDLRAVLGRWQAALAERGWNSLYWCNHDQPRVVSRFGNDTRYRYESATALAMLLHMHRGTPYVYQGEEIGMTNLAFDDIADFRDLESLRYHEDAVAQGEDPETVMAALRRASRDNARTPMQWNALPGAGFTQGVPWIPVNPNHVWLNAAQDRAEPRSIYRFYQSLIALRYSEPAVVGGDFALLLPTHSQIYALRRTLDDEVIEVYVNLSDEPATAAGEDLGPRGLVLGNYRDHLSQTLAPWEARAYRR